jgi:hypothetical protein
MLVLMHHMGTVVYATSGENEQASGPATQKQDKLMNRIDFGNAYIMGQSITSGAVYLLNRKKSDIESMLKDRTDYRREIAEDSFVIQEKREDPR